MTGAPTLTPGQRSLYEHLLDRHARGAASPSLDEVCTELGAARRMVVRIDLGALVNAGLIEPPARGERAIVLREPAEQIPTQLPLLGLPAGFDRAA